MKKTKLTRTLLAACSIVALSAVMYGCTGDGAENDLAATQTDLEKAEMERDAALAAQAEAEAARDAALAAQATAEAAKAAADTARDAALAAQAMAEGERDAANMAAAAAAEAQATAEAAQAAAEAAQATAEAAQAAAETAQADAEAAQATAEAARDAAMTAQMVAEAAAAVSEQARMDAEAARATAETARAEAAAAQATAEADAAAANQRAMAAEAAATAAEQRATDAAAAQAAAEMARDTARQAQMDAETAQMAAETARDAAVAAQTAAEQQRDAAIMERDSAQSDLATANADLATANADLATANADLATANADLATANADLEQARADRDKYKQMLDDAAQDIADKEMLDRGRAVAAAITMNRVSTDPGTNADRETPNATGGFGALASQLPFAGATGVSAMRGHDGMVTVDVTLTDTEATKFAGDAASAGTTWTGAMLTRDLGEGTTASEETLMVYTDIGAPTAWPLATEFSADESFIAITDAAGLERVMVDSAPAVGDDRSFNYAQNAEFTGSYRGVPGTFTCGAGGCTVSTAENGTVTVTGTMNFEPTDPAATYPRQDASYVYFGWWLNKPASATADHMVEAFAGTNGGTAAAVTAAMEGKATYTGPAIGKYVVQTSTAGVVTSAEAGHFTALATLNADFLDGTDLGTISGKVDGFDTSGDADGSAWRVNLKEFTLTTDANVNARTSVSFGGLTADNAGAWRGTFYDAGTGDAAAPGTIIGTFDAHDAGGSANISGAFGAKKQ